MPSPQPGILPEANAHALFLVLAAADAQAVAAGLSGCQRMAAELAAQHPDACLVMNAGIGSDLWDRLRPREPRPRLLAPFRAIGSAPSTGGDVFLHVASARRDLCFELARRVVATLGPGTQVLEEVHGFRYLDTRDLTGFIDGTENPKGDERAAAALIGDEDAAFAGGSYVATQRYVHDLDAWSRVGQTEQEAIIGRTKPDSVQLPDDVKPPTAHISRAVIERDGEELQIVRHSYPYGSVREAGLFFVAYARTPEHFELMLARMMGVSGDGVRDRLMDFSRAVTGAAFFLPSMEVLAVLS